MILRGTVGLLTLLLPLMLVGCGTNLEEVLYQTLTAAARTQLDIVLTDVANEISVQYDDDDAAPADEDGDDGDDGGDGDGGATDGAGLYAANCASCHGDDGASGFAPDITGMTVDELAAGLESGSHGSISLADDDVAAIAELLGGGGGGADAGGGDADAGGGETDGEPDTDTGDGGAANGPDLYASNCAACHGDDGASGFAPDITGATTDQLLTALESPSHGSISLTDDEVAAIASFLGG